MAAGQAGMALHTMAILQVHQADVLKEMDEGDSLTPEAVKELRKAKDLALRVTKHTARTVGRSMVGSVTTEHHLWLNLTVNSTDLEAVGMTLPGPKVSIYSLPAEVQETIANARATATKKLYSSKWKVFKHAQPMQYTQSTALLVQCWSSCKRDLRQGRLPPP